MRRPWMRYLTAGTVWIAGLIMLAVIVTYLEWPFIPTVLLGAAWGYAAIPLANWANSTTPETTRRRP